MKKQVRKDHYNFHSYMKKTRWSSIWHQLDEVSKLSPKSTLEIGPGPGIFKVNAKMIGLDVETVDLDSELKPDHVASVTELPFSDCSYDLVCAFQMLEHLPFEKSLVAFSEICRTSKKHIIISLPNASYTYNWRIQLPLIGPFWMHIPKPSFKREIHSFDGEHYWELNKKDYSEKYVLKKLLDECKGLKLLKNYRVEDNPYHSFFIFEK